MTRLTLQFENPSIMKHLIKIIELMKGVSIVETESDRKQPGLDVALDDIKAGKVYKAKDTKDLFEQILG